MKLLRTSRRGIGQSYTTDASPRLTFAGQNPRPKGTPDPGRPSYITQYRKYMQ